ncbi:MAG TPA: PRTRC system ThiF family protein [Terriglobia bacterium]|nr:PRTRC system ThiF family protein [Terriglobia bacterium]
METHRLHGELLDRRIRVLVVGCGGTGSSIIGGLPYLHQAMLAQGHPYRLHVTVMDGDTVSPFNCVRQPFSRAELGLNKAIVLVNRLNIFWGLDWEAVPESLTENHRLRQMDIVIGCVDMRAARAVIERQTTGQSATHYAIDIGNGQSSGQFVLGEPLNTVNRRSRTRLRTAAELFPEIIDAALDNDSQPSCSAIEALERQHCFVNSVLAQHALALLARLFRYGEINYHGAFVDVASSRAVPLPVDPLLWRQVRKRGRQSARGEARC